MTCPQCDVVNKYAYVFISELFLFICRKYQYKSSFKKRMFVKHNRDAETLTFNFEFECFGRFYFYDTSGIGKMWFKWEGNVQLKLSTKIIIVP